jgi:hypothetical protein
VTNSRSNHLIAGLTDISVQWTEPQRKPPRGGAGDHLRSTRADVGTRTRGPAVGATAGSQRDGHIGQQRRGNRHSPAQGVATLIGSLDPQLFDLSESLTAQLVPPPVDGQPRTCWRCRIWSDLTDEDQCSNCTQVAAELDGPAVPLDLIALYRKPSQLRMVYLLQGPT